MNKATEPGPLTDADLARVRRHRNDAPTIAAQQSWSRILEALELAKIAQDAVAEAAHVGGPS